MAWLVITLLLLLMILVARDADKAQFVQQLAMSAN